MTPLATERFEHARQIADAVLYEGYVLFPYHATATKNRYRWQFGVLAPSAQVGHDAAEAAAIQSQLLLRCGPATLVDIAVRFLHPCRRQVEHCGPDGQSVPVDQLEVDGHLHTTWEEGREHEERLGPYSIAALLSEERGRDIHLSEVVGREELREASGRRIGHLVHRCARVDLRVQVHAERLDSDVIRLTTRVTNITDWDDVAAPRSEVVRHGVAGLHLLLATSGGVAASMIDPPTWAQPWSEACRNVGTFPVLVGSDDRDDAHHGELVLSSPIILYDHPQIAEESPGDAYDATEIHELLTLCTTALTDEEKRAARATDPRAAAVIDDADHLPPELRARLHGALRGLVPPPVPANGITGRPTIDPVGGRAPETIHRPPTAQTRGPATHLDGTRLNEPAGGHQLDDELAAFLGVGADPLTEVDADGRRIALGDRVRLRPRRRADAQDVFVEGRIAIVGKLVETLDGEVQVGVTLEDDPAAEFHEWYGRFLYFHLEEITPPDDRGGPM